MNALEHLFLLMPKMPSGAIDPKAPEKLVRELGELHAELGGRNDPAEALLEAADVAWYAARCIALAADLVGVAPQTVLATAIAKYRLRAQPGNPKDPAREHAVAQAIWTLANNEGGR